MKTKFLLTACLVAMGMSLQAKNYDYKTVDGDLTKTRIYTLDNGLKVYLSINKEKPRIQTYIAVRTGSKNDPAETTGLAHYLEHLMFKGTKQFGTSNPDAEAPYLNDIKNRYEAYRKLTDNEARKKAYHEIDSVSQLAAQYNIPNEYDKLMAAIGAQGTNAYTSNDVTCYTEDIPSNEIENWAKIQSDRFQNMVIRGFHTELEAVYEEYNIGLSSDQRKLFATTSKMLWPNHPYGTQTTIGTQEHLKNPSIVNIENYFNKWYRPNNVAICMAGDFDFDQTIAIIDKYFSGWKPGADVKQPVFASLPPLTSPKDTTIVGQEAEQIWVAWRAKQANSLQADTLELMEDVLSNGRAGLFDLGLNQTMKVQRAGAGSELMHDHGGFFLIGSPKQGQSLDEVKTLMLGEIDKLKKGDFPDNLLPSIINNKKRQYYMQLEDNRSRADLFVDAFINEVEWKQKVGKIDRISKITKKEIVDFANNFFGNGYVIIYKKQGIDSLQKKIDKPAITPIPANRDKMSQFVKDIQNAKVEPIQPKFVDFKKDITFTETKSKLPLRYVKNNENGLFELEFQFEFGREADNRYGVARDYMNYLGTEFLTNAEIKQKFYELACDYYLYEGNDNITVSLYGLSENMSKALELLENLWQNVKTDKAAYNQMVAKILKQRDDAKKDQRRYYSTLSQYGMYGKRNASTDIMSEQQLKETDPQVLIDLLKNLKNYKHSINYYGPMSVNEVSSIISNTHKTAKQLKEVPQGKPYVKELATKDEVWIAPYDAKNIYMRMFCIEDNKFNPDEAAIKEIFNEYYGGSMASIVFQEMRESRGLAYNAYAYYADASYKDEPEFAMVHIITQNDKMMDCVRQFNNILDTIPQSAASFKVAKDAVQKRIASDRTTKYGLITKWLWAKQRGIDYDENERIYKALPGTTLDDIVKFEQARMAHKTWRYVILGNEHDLNIKELEKIAPIRRLTTEEIFGY